MEDDTYTILEIGVPKENKLHWPLLFSPLDRSARTQRVPHLLGRLACLDSGYTDVTTLRNNWIFFSHHMKDLGPHDSLTSTEDRTHKGHKVPECWLIQ